MFTICYFIKNLVYCIKIRNAQIIVRLTEDAKDVAFDPSYSIAMCSLESNGFSRFVSELVVPILIIVREQITYSAIPSFFAKCA